MKPWLALMPAIACTVEPALTCPAGTDPATGPTAGALAGSLVADIARVQGFGEAWDASAWSAGEDGDEVLWCAARDGTARGPVLVRLARPGVEVRGTLDEDGLRDGAWTGAWLDPPAPAFSGTWEHGVPSGVWAFDAPDGREVARGSFARGAPHGTWTVWSDTARTDLRYVYGVPHGTYREQGSDGREVRGHYFDGTRNYEWDFLIPDPAADDVVVEKREAWKYDTFVARWDPRIEKNPLPGMALPGDPLGPDAEGICKVHATCATNAFLTTMLAGIPLDGEKLWETPILVDYAEASARLPEGGRIVLVDSYHIDEVALAADETHAAVSVTLETVCTVGAPDEPVQATAGAERVALDLVYEEGVWRFVRPPAHLFVRLDAFLLRARERDAAWAERVLATCRGAGGG